MLCFNVNQRTCCYSELELLLIRLFFLYCREHIGCHVSFGCCLGNYDCPCNLESLNEIEIHATNYYEPLELYRTFRMLIVSRLSHVSHKVRDKLFHISYQTLHAKTYLRSTRNFLKAKKLNCVIESFFFVMKIY